MSVNLDLLTASWKKNLLTKKASPNLVPTKFEDEKRVQENNMFSRRPLKSKFSEYVFTTPTKKKVFRLFFTLKVS